VLKRSEEKVIVDVVFNDPYNIPETSEFKKSIVDVRCTDKQGNQYIIEMQVTNQKDYSARAVYYSSLALSRQLQKGQKYDQLVPVIFIGVLDFELFTKHHYMSNYYIQEEASQERINVLEFHFIELPKFNKMLEALESVLDKWIYLLKEANQLDEIPQSMREKSPIRDAFDVLVESNWSRLELEAYDRYLDAIRSYESQLETAEEIGLKKGLKKGLEKGREEGKLDVARKMLLKFEVESVAEITGLSIDAIKKLKK
jgi:predicted transposase/invertase (TIGR01784 family)